jgi:cytochrome c553
VIVIFPKDTYASNDPKVGVGDQSLARGSLGTVPIEDDGSVYFTMPAGCEFYMQVIDEKGIAVQTMRSGTYVHPGEKMSCIGCHEPKHTGSLREGRMPKAFMRPPSVLKPEGEGTFPITFPRLVQPVLDKHCVTCHDQQRANGNKQVPSLSSTIPNKQRWGWSEAYCTLTKNHAKPDSMAWAMCGGNGVMEHHNELQYSVPGKIGARVTKLYKMLTAGHKEVKLSPEEMRRITCWLDCNSVFYGAYQSIEAQSKGSLVWPKLGLPIGFNKREGGQ